MRKKERKKERKKSLGKWSGIVLVFLFVLTPLGPVASIGGATHLNSDSTEKSAELVKNTMIFPYHTIPLPI